MNCKLYMFFGVGDTFSKEVKELSDFPPNPIIWYVEDN